MIISLNKVAFILAVFIVFSIISPAGAGSAEQKLLFHDSKMEDTDSGLEWAIDAGTPSFMDCAGGKKTWQEAYDYVNCLNAREYLGYRDWRLPSTHELSGLVSKLAHEYKKERGYEIAGPRLKELGFTNIKPSLYWSSISLGDEAALAVEVLTGGEFHPVGKLNALYVWPVRGAR